jgi:hypothetical protein
MKRSAEKCGTGDFDQTVREFDICQMMAIGEEEIGNLGEILWRLKCHRRQFAARPEDRMAQSRN